MVNLYLYHNLQINHNNTFYVFNTLAQLKNKINGNLAHSLTADNYRINTNTIKVANVGAYSYDDITYAIEEVIDNGVTIFWRAYHVNSISYQSGFALLSISVDLWANYYYKASLSNIHVVRCNRLIDTPIFDDIKATTGQENYLSVDSNGAVNGIATPDYLGYYQEIRRYYLILVVNYNAKQNLTGSDIASTTSVFAIKLDTLRNKYIDNVPDEPQRSDYETQEEYTTAYNNWYNGLTNEQKQLYFNESAVEMARDFAGGIFGISSSGFSKNDAHVVSAYIVNGQFLSISGWEVEYESVSILRHGNLSLRASLLEGSDQVQKSLYIRSLSLNKKIYAGLNHGGLLLNRVINEDYAEVFIRVTIGPSSVDIVLSQGDNQADITSAFELTITNNVTQTTMLRQIAHALVKTDSTYRGVTKGIESGAKQGGTAGAIVGGGLSFASSIASMVGDFNILSGIRGNGDALNTFGGYGNYVKVPYKATAYTSIDNEEENARNKGATFSKYITSIESLFDTSSYTLLGSGSLTSTFIIASCNIDGIPTDASDFIKNVLASGAYLIDART